MCDFDVRRGYGWRGWRCPASPSALRPIGDWVDLSHRLDGDTPRVPFFPKPVFEQIYRMPERQLNVTRMEMVVHIGTHVDSPRHFFLDGPALEDVPLERLGGRGIVWPLDVSGDTLIEPEHFAGLRGKLAAGDILILNTGWHRHVGSAAYDDHHPALGVAAAQWIVERGVKLVGFDTPTPDLPVARRPEGFDYPVHRTLLSNGVLIAEHLTNLSALDGRYVEVLCACLNITGGDGAPARVMARAIEA